PPRKSEKRFGRHPTQKPVSLLMRIITAASREGDLVLDPFMGSGTTGIASAILGRRFLGIDMNEEYLNIAKSRYEFRDEELQEKLDKTFKRTKTLAAKTLTTGSSKPRRKKSTTSDLFNPEV
ncbi:site-specific DNA-methyltransferase, partial [Myxococcota bacterium]|nr:site-specific DNA-methyltransferase [Myxococcota bacterium]